MSKFTCEFCNKNFQNKGNLKTHQENAKYCINIRNNSANSNTDNKCEFCDKILSSRSRLDSHKNKCRSKNLYNKFIETQNDLKHKDEQLKKAEQQIKDLQNQIKELASLAIDKPNTINHNVNNNSNNRVVDNRTLNMSPFNLTEEKIMHILKEKFEEKHLMRGQESLADFCVENILVTADKKFLYRCSDPSRNHFFYLDETGKIQKDINGHHLIQLINEPVRQRTRELYQECSDRYFDSENNEENEEQTDKDEDRLMYISNKVVEITSLKNNNSKFLNRLKAPIVVNK